MQYAEAAQLASNTLSDTAKHAEEGIHVLNLSAEQLGTFFGMPITNTLVTSWIITILLIVIAFFVGKNIKMIPGKIQSLFEVMFDFIMNFMEQILESKKLAHKFFPLIVTIFLFVFTANVTEFVPGIGSIGFFQYDGAHTVFAPILRSINTDLNMTLALAIISFLVIEIAGITAIGFWKYAGKFINFKSPLAFIVGLIELMSETIRLVSFSFRLFGNIFAGEVLIAVVSFFVPYFLPVPIMAFEMFIGFVQAAIFSLLTLLFIKLAVTEPH